MTPHCSPAHFCAFFVLLRTFAHFCAHFFSLQNPCPRRDFFRTGSFTDIKFEVQNAFLKVTTVGSFSDPFVLTAPGLFSGKNTDTWETDKAGTYYIAINKDVTTTLCYSIGGVTQKENEINTKANYIYLLGELTAETAEGWAIVGEHQGWDKTAGDALYKVPGTNTYARCNVTLKKKNTSEFGFKFHNAGVNIDMTPYTLLKPNSNWTQSSAWFAVYTWTPDKWIKMENALGGYYAVKTSELYSKFLFARMASGSAESNMNWNDGKVWNQSSDLTKQSNGNNAYAVNGWNKGGGSWSKVSPLNTGEIWIGNGSTANQMNSWRQQWSNNGGNNNIGVANYDKAHDIYLNVGAHQPWGFEVFWQVVEHGATPQTLK